MLVSFKVLFLLNRVDKMKSLLLNLKTKGLEIMGILRRCAHLTIRVRKILGEESMTL